MKKRESLKDRIKNWESKLGDFQFEESIHKYLKKEEKPSFYTREVEEICARCKACQEGLGNACEFPEKQEKPCGTILKIAELADSLFDELEPFFERGFGDFNTQLGDNPHFTGYTFQDWFDN